MTQRRELYHRLVEPVNSKLDIFLQTFRDDIFGIIRYVGVSMGYADISKSPRKSAEGWMDAVRSVFGIGRKSVNAPTVAPVAPATPTNPYTQKDGEVALAFRVGGRYYHAGKNRVFECIAVKGKRARSVFFSALDAIERNRAWIEDDKKYGIVEGFNKVRIEGGVETADRSNLRADRFATDAEVAEELDFLKGIRAKQERTKT